MPRPYGHDAVVDVDGVAERVPRSSVRREEFGNLSTGGRIEEIRGTRAIEIVVVFPRPYGDDTIVDGDGDAEIVTRRSVTWEEFGDLSTGGRTEQIRRTRVGAIVIVKPRPYSDNAVVDGDGDPESVIRRYVTWEEFCDLSTGGRIEKIRRTRVGAIVDVEVSPYGDDAVVDGDGEAEPVKRHSVACQ